MKTSLMIILVGFFLSMSWIGYLGFGWFEFNTGSEVMVDGITISAGNGGFNNDHDSFPEPLFNVNPNNQ